MFFSYLAVTISYVYSPILQKAAAHLPILLKHRRLPHSPVRNLRARLQSTMPPFGLYPVPQHHLYGALPSMARPSFNSMDFQNDVPEPAAITQGGAVQTVSEAFQRDIKQGRKKKEKKRKRHSLEAPEERETDQGKNTPRATAADVAPTVVNSKSHMAKDRKRANVEGDVSTKKRKRESEEHRNSLRAPRNEVSNNSSILGNGFLHVLKTTLGDLSASFGDPIGVAQSPKKLPRKKKESSSKISKSNDGTVNGAANEVALAEGKPKKKRGRPRKSTLANDFESPTKARVPSAANPYATIPKQTPIPLPWNSPARLARTTNEPHQKRSKDNCGGSQIATETIPSGHPASVSAAPLDTAKTISGRKPSTSDTVRSQNHFISSSLRQYTQPLNDEPRSRPHSRAQSITTSTGSSTTSLSTPEVFSHVGKPYSRSGAEFDPFTVPEIKKKKYRETHEEGDMKAFTAAFKASQWTVNFTDEREYMDQFLSWRAHNNASPPIPCLNKATGCNAKQEQTLRLARQNASKVPDPSDHTAAVLNDAKQRCAHAQSLLALAVTARVPIPIGPIEGTWTLHCPKYSETHMDKYNTGQRTLTISPTADCTSSHTYTARLTLPPRTLAYTIPSFSAPPHASFRATTLRTGAEAYSVSVIFLGNGYLHLRLDLHLLLLGRPMEGVGGRAVLMEFVGVHESAIRWREERDELEEVGRRLFAKYDGGMGEE